ncbi:MAG: GDSL-type esterase/lipase family protein [Christensenellaceae bacterium]|jgi:lysophospholipase L1-like esterase|nr:GDSL-type esterase/lipase family protein [Christensenellaceae bacterium]
MRKTFSIIITLVITLAVVGGSVWLYKLFNPNDTTQEPPTGNMQINTEYWKNISWASYGDSITQQGGWQDEVVNMLGIKRQVNLGVGATLISNSGSRPMCSAERLQQIKNADPELLTIFGGINDSGSNVAIGKYNGDLATFKGGYSYIIEYLQEWKPTMDIVLIVPHNCYAMVNNFSVYQNAVRQIANHYELPYIDLAVDGGINDENYTEYLVDGVHLTESGKTLIGRIIAEKINEIKGNN